MNRDRAKEILGNYCRNRELMKHDENARFLAKAFKDVDARIAILRSKFYKLTTGTIDLELQRKADEHHDRLLAQLKRLAS